MRYTGGGISDVGLASSKSIFITCTASALGLELSSVCRAEWMCRSLESYSASMLSQVLIAPAMHL